jgi:hypothetical protein
MNNNPTPWVDPADRQLSELVAAASAPGTDAELRNEEHSVAMFRSADVLRAHLLGAPLESLTARRESMSPKPRTNRIAARSLAAAIAAFVLATAGIALAASGNLPGDGQGNGFGNDDDQESSRVVEPQVSDENDQGEDEQDDSTSEEVTDETDTNETSDSVTDEVDESTTQSFRGLCRALTVGNKAEHGKALEAPPFVGLIEAAGGIENVKAYCTELIATSTKPAKGEKPEHPSKPEHPGKPEHPSKPDHPAKPGKGERPDKPAKSDHQKPDHGKLDHPVKP